MSTERPPTIDPQAAARWARMSPLTSPWLHEEVARRMEERLQWIVLKPRQWVHWEPLQGGVQAQALLTRRYPKAESFVVQNHAEQAQAAHKLIAKPWWNPARWRAAKVRFGVPAQPVHMLWANMALHMAPDPQALMARWSALVAPDGFLMFSCLGPDTLRELRTLYAAMGWPAPSHEFTDMHDWGDMLVRAGFAEPVMDMQRITLTFASPQRLLQELRALGRNLHPARFAGLRGRAWLAHLTAAMDKGLRQPQAESPLQLTFEIVYGHAFKPPPRLAMQPHTTVSLDAMRHALRSGKGPL
jgi:malonyl-CoA O-methyltransferase